MRCRLRTQTTGAKEMDKLIQELANRVGGLEELLKIADEARKWQIVNLGAKVDVSEAFALVALIDAIRKRKALAS